MCTYCGSGFILLIYVQLYKQNRYRDTEIKGYVEGVKSSSIYPIRAVMLCMSKVLRYRSNVDIFSRIELFPSNVLSSEKTNYKNDIQ